MKWVEEIRNYIPNTVQEEEDKKVILECIEAFDDVLKRENKIAHITSSGFIVNKERDKLLMVHHNIFNEWSWTGGHADGEEDLLSVAVKEGKEETGVEKLMPVSTGIFSLDILPVKNHIKRGKYISAHLHLSIAYLLEAEEGEELIAKLDENSGVRWIELREIEQYTNEDHMLKIYKKIISKMKLNR